MYHGNMTELIEDIEKRPIPDTKYEIDQHGFVYNKGRRLRSQYKSGRWYCRIYTKAGRQLSIDVKKLADLLFSESAPPKLTREIIEGRINARPLPEHPRYSVTEYGAVYCMEPPRRGPNAGKLYMVSTKTNVSGKKYVALYDYEGCNRYVQVQALVDSVW
tara:strand:- start:2340 stop:2819 length:480 start_codon:yes stop_codon:yes gene_type:complete